MYRKSCCTNPGIGIGGGGGASMVRMLKFFKVNGKALSGLNFMVFNVIQGCHGQGKISGK